MTRPKLALAALLTAALVVASLPLAVFAQAAPRLRITDTIYKQLPGGEKKDLTFAHLSHFTDPNNFYATAGADLETFKRDSSAALDNGAWGFTQHTFTVGDRPAGTPMFFFTQKKDCNFTIHYFSGSDRFDIRSGSTDPGCRFSYLFSNADSSRFYYKPNYSTGVTISTGQTDAIRLLFFTGDYTLDPSAEGLVPGVPKDPSRPGVVNAREVIAPEFSYEIKGKELSVAHLKEHDKIQMTAFSEYTKDGWSLKNGTYQVAFTVQYKKGGDVVVPQQVIDAGGRFSVILPDNGEYSVTAQYVATACYSYGPNSATPPYCINATPSDSDTLDYQSKVAYLIIDGRDKSGSTLALTCLHGFCQEEPLYEDCSVYDLKFSAWEGGPEFSLPTIDGIACSLRNSLKWFVNELILPLFVPRSDYFSSRFGELQSNIKRSFGFLALPFTFIGNIFTSVSQGAFIGETCALPPLSLYGATATIHLCAWRQQLPQAWSFLQLVIQGGIALSFLWVAYSLLMRFFGVNVPGEDADEEFEEVRWHDERDGSTGDWERRRR